MTRSSAISFIAFVINTIGNPAMTQTRWRLAVSVPPIGIADAPNTELLRHELTAFFSTRADAEAAAQLMRTAYHGQGFAITIAAEPAPA